jgi:hypothetical protein
MAIANNAGGGALSGTPSAAAVNGVATFANLSIDKSGTGYTLAATSRGLAGATSAAFEITGTVASIVSQVMQAVAQSQPLPAPPKMPAQQRVFSGILAWGPRPTPSADAQPLVTAWQAAALGQQQLGIHEGNGQVEFQGTQVAIAPAVRVTNGLGRPVVGVTVTFAVTVGGGSVANSSAATGGDGVASAGRWTLGPAAGNNIMTATVAAVGTVEFTAIAISRVS